MSSDRLLPSVKRSPPDSGWKHFLLRTRRGQLLLLLCAVRLLGTLGVVPPALNSIATFGLWAYLTIVAVWGLGRLRNKLLWRIRRKLVISYLLIGLVPTVLILAFFVVMGYFSLGQMSSYMLNTTVQRAETNASRAADLTLAQLGARRESASRFRDGVVRRVLEERTEKLPDSLPGAGSIYLEHRRGRIQRVVATSDWTATPEVGTRLPDWLAEGFQGTVQIAGSTFTAGSSSPASGSESATVIVLAPLRGVLDRAALELGFHVDQVLASVASDSDESNVFAPLGGAPKPPIQARPSWTIPWWALFSTERFDAPQSESSQLVFVQFGFPFINFYQSIASGALPLGPSRPDVGQLLVTGMVLLAGLFLVIQVFAIFVGFVLARSITGSVHALSQGTEHVRQGDFSYKVHIRSRDQLGELAESFNLMTTSIQDLLRQGAEKERLEEELRIARSIQMSLLPKDRVHVAGLSISALCLPATEVGGDYYDFIPIDEDRCALLIADVSGKGTSAALYMAELKGLVLSLSQIYHSPRKLLVEANKILAANMDSRSFITMVYAVIDMKQRVMTYARAGHNPIFHLPASSPLEIDVLAPDGMGLALDKGPHFERVLREASVPLGTGDLFLFFTDGLSEAMNPDSELFGEDRIRAIVEKNQELDMEELREKMVDEVFDFSAGAMQHDDMTMVLVKVL